MRRNQDTLAFESLQELSDHTTSLCEPLLRATPIRHVGYWELDRAGRFFMLGSRKLPQELLNNKYFLFGAQLPKVAKHFGMSLQATRPDRELIAHLRADFHCPYYAAVAGGISCYSIAL